MAEIDAQTTTQIGPEEVRVSPATITQIMNLLLLAPEIQERLLFLPAVERGRDSMLLRDLQAVAREAGWGRQRYLLQ